MPHLRVTHIRGTNLSVTHNRDAVTLNHLNDGNEKLESQESDISPHQDREEESRADLLTGNREVPPSTLREDPEEMITLDQEEGKGAS